MLTILHCHITQAYSHDSVRCATVFFQHMVKVLGHLSRFWYNLFPNNDMLRLAYDLVASSSMDDHHCRSIMCFRSVQMTVLIIMLFASVSLDCGMFCIPDCNFELDVVLPVEILVINMPCLCVCVCIIVVN